MKSRADERASFFFNIAGRPLKLICLFNTKGVDYQQISFIDINFAGVYIFKQHQHQGREVPILEYVPTFDNEVKYKFFIDIYLYVGPKTKKY